MSDQNLNIFIKVRENLSAAIGRTKLSLKDANTSFRKGFAESGQAVQHLAERTGTAAGLLMNPITLGIAGLAAFTFATKKAVDKAEVFQAGMADVATLVDTTAVNLDALGQGVLELGVKVGKAAGDMTKGLYQAISGGIDASESLKFMEDAAKAASAGTTAVATSVDILTTTLNAYGDGAEQAGYHADLMFTAVKEGKTTFSELASSLGTVVAPAAALDVSLEELLAATATLTKGGLDTATSTTALRATLMSILSPADEAKKVAADLGLEWSANAIKTKGLIPFLNEMKEATGGNIEVMAKLIPEARALNAVLALTGSQSEELNRIFGEMQTAAGATDEAFEKQQATFTAAKARFSAAVNRILIILGSELLPGLTKVVNFLTDSLGPAFKIIFPLIIALTMPIRSVAMVFGELIDIGRSFVDFVKDLDTNLQKLVKGSLLNFLRGLNFRGVFDDRIAELENFMEVQNQVGDTVRVTEADLARLKETERDLAKATRETNVVLGDQEDVLDDLGKSVDAFEKRFQDAGKTRLQILRENYDRDLAFAEENSLAKEKVHLQYQEKINAIEQQEVERQKIKEQREKDNLARKEQRDQDNLVREEQTKLQHQERIATIQDEYRIRTLENEGLEWEADRERLRIRHEEELEELRQNNASKGEIENLRVLQNQELHRGEADQIIQLQQEKAQAWENFKSNFTSTLTQIGTVFGASEKKMFRMNKASNLANSIMNVARGITDALKTGNWGQAAAIGLRGAVQIATIRKQSFSGGGAGGGGGGVSVSGGGAAATTPAEVAQQAVEKTTQPTYVTNYHIHGAVFGDLDSAGRALKPAIDKAAADGVA